SFSRKVSFGYPGFQDLESKSVMNLITGGRNDKEDLEFMYSLVNNELFNEFVFDLVKYYIVGVIIDLERFYFDFGKFFGFEFKFESLSNRGNGFLYQPI